MNKTFNVLELASELADKKLLETFDGVPYQTEENGDTRYTEEAQDYFNELYDEYYNFLLRLTL